MRPEHTDSSARLHEHGLVGCETPQAREDAVEVLPTARRLAGAAVDDQTIRILGNLGVEVVLDHPIGRLDLPVRAMELVAAGCANGTGP